METEVIMKRELFGMKISQKSKSEFFSATDLNRAGNMWRAANGLYPIYFTDWVQRAETKEFISALESKYGTVKISGRGRGVHTWIHPYLFIDFALAISPQLKIEVYKWLHDYLLRYRNDSGDSYKKMAGALYEKHGDKRSFPKKISEVAKTIIDAVGVESWETATEDQLKKRDRIHENIAMLTDILPMDEAVRMGILHGMKCYEVRT